MYKISIRRFLAMTAGVLGLVFMAGPSSAASEQSPTDSVKTTVAELIQILGNQDLNDPSRSDERRLQIERALRDRISYEDMARRSLGRAWTDLTEAEREEFVDLFVQFLARSLASWRFERDLYGKTINDYAGELIMYLSEEREDRFSEVKTKLRSHKVDTRLDFRMVNDAGQWRVYDVVVDHVSLAGNYRSQFANIIRLISLSELEEKIKKTIPILKLFELVTPR